jgi:glycosyltransferase involved in cell wall biosynthesis
LPNIEVSIVIAILNSHEVVRRQLLYFQKMNLSDEVEFVFVDDGSKPPIDGELKNLTIHRTNDFRPWTQPMARNIGARIASGEYLICTDIDHIVSKALIERVMVGDYDVYRFKREAGVLDENGNFTQDMNELKKYGLPERSLRLPAHGNSYAIRRGIFLALGGSQQKEQYPNRDEIPIKRGIKRLETRGDITRIPDDDRPTIYMIPNGRFCGDKDYNPFGLFHDLKR